MDNIRSDGTRLRQILGLDSYPVGVKFLYSDDKIPQKPEKLTGYRYCQALMKARRGEHVLLDAEGIACPAAAAAFGFKQLPEGLKTGKGLVGFGIVKEDATARIMFEGMTTLPMGRLKALYLSPLETADIEPEIVVVEDEAEKLMWIALAYLNVQGGKRVKSSTAILQATCVDATIIPFKEQQLNMSMGCYGCRDATDIGNNETVMGFPFKDFHPVLEVLEFLNQKAIPDSRSKNAFAMLKRKDAEEISKTVPLKTKV
ncbi:MAG: DUF169 domain-containing protein [Bacteroidales bacterium]|nr:DUF169 domain-containing protein [Bacteroidales bacterium]